MACLRSFQGILIGFKCGLLTRSLQKPSFCFVLQPFRGGRELHGSTSWPSHYTTTTRTTFDGLYDVPFMKCCVACVMRHKSSRKFSLISPQNFPKSLHQQIIKMFLGKYEMRFVFFLVDSSFLLGSLPWPFFPVSFLLLNHER